MQEIGRIVTKVKWGIGPTLLCLAGACYISVKTLIMADDWVKKDTRDKVMADAVEAVKTIDRITSRIIEREKAEKKEEEES